MTYSVPSLLSHFDQMGIDDNSTTDQPSKSDGFTTHHDNVKTGHEQPYQPNKNHQQQSQVHPPDASSYYGSEGGTDVESDAALASGDRMDLSSPEAELTNEQIFLLARRIAAEQFGVLHCDPYITNIDSGSYNVVYIVELHQNHHHQQQDSGHMPCNKLAIRVPKMPKGLPLSPLAAEAVHSQVTTLWLIHNKTSIPVPKIYDYDVTNDNELNAPYMCISFLPGKPVYRLLAESGVNGETRRTILSSLARLMAQLAPLTFNAYGCLSEDDDGNLSIGPCFLEAGPDENGALAVVSAPPFNTEGQMWAHHYQLSMAKVADQPDMNHPLCVGEDKIMKILLRCVQHLEATNHNNVFVLAPPDFDSQNVLVDDAGNVTGIIDWDLIHTVPRHLGYAAYPRFLSMDWNPAAHDWKYDKTTSFAQTWRQLGEYRA